MHRYRVLLSQRSWRGPLPVPLTPEWIAGRLEGVVVRQFLRPSDGGYAVVLELPRVSHQQALDDIALVFELAGLDVAQLVVERSATYAIEGALLGGACGATAASATRQVAAILITTGVCSIIGALIGQQKLRVVSRHEARRDWGGTWTFYPIAVGGTNTAAI